MLLSMSFQHFLLNDLGARQSHSCIGEANEINRYINIWMKRAKVKWIKNSWCNFYLRAAGKSFLVDRQQFVRISEHRSDVLKCDTGCPQGCVLSPILFSIYTDFIRANHTDIKIFKYADDMAIESGFYHRMPRAAPLDF